MCAQKINDVKMHVKCTHETLVCCRVHHCLHEQCACTRTACTRTALVHFGLHKHACFSTHFTCFIGVHSGLAYSQVIDSKPNMCVRVYYYTTESIRTFYKFRADNVNSVTLLNKFMVSYGDIQMTTCILTL